MVIAFSMDSPFGPSTAILSLSIGTDFQHQTRDTSAASERYPDAIDPHSDGRTAPLGGFATPKMAEQNAHHIAFLLAVESVREVDRHRFGYRPLVGLADPQPLQVGD